MTATRPDPAAMTANLITQLTSLATSMDDVARLMLMQRDLDSLYELHAHELRGAADLVRDWIDHLSHPEETP
jgi:hypothetical protein